VTLAIDRFRLPPHLEAQAQRNAEHLFNEPSLLLGYLSSSVAIALERPRWKDRDQLAVDLRTVQIAKGKRHIADRPGEC
jgi:hypothetical protein